MTPYQDAAIEFYMAAFMAFLLFFDWERNKVGTSSWFFRGLIIYHMGELLFDTIMGIMRVTRLGNLFLFKTFWSLSFLCSVAVVCFYSFYLHSFVQESTEGKREYPYRFAIIIVAIAVLFWFSGYFSDYLFTMYDDFTYSYGPLYPLIYAILILIPDLSLVLRKRTVIEKRLLRYFFFYLFIPILAMTMDFIHGLDYFFQVGVTLSIIFMYVGVKQRLRLTAYEQLEVVQAKKAELKETEQKVMMGNIQPMFIQSILISIADMAPKNPKKAEETTSTFATYLRMNLNNMGKNEPVPFEEELRHAGLFLDLESNVWPGRIKVEHDEEAFDFFLPVLTLQPLVENALLHGILPKGGGTIRLWSREEEKCFVVGVDDDGIGFDATLPGGVGLSNTRSRIDKFCKGEVVVTSEVGKGTSVVLRIPKHENLTE